MGLTNLDLAWAEAAEEPEQIIVFGETHTLPDGIPVAHTLAEVRYQNIENPTIEDMMDMRVNQLASIVGLETVDGWVHNHGMTHHQMVDLINRTVRLIVNTTSDDGEEADPAGPKD